MALEHEEQFVRSERAVLVDEADAGVELRISGQALFDSGHTDEHEADLAAVVVVPQLFESCCAEPVGLVDDDQFRCGRVWAGGWPCACGSAPR